MNLILRSFEEAENCLFLDRLYYVFINLIKGRKVLSIKSVFFETPSFTRMNIAKLKRMHYKVQDEFRKMYVGNLPYMLEYEVMNLLSEYGELRSFVDISKDKSMVECHCEYTTDEATDDALKKLNSLKLKGRSIIAKRAVLMNPDNKTKVTSKVVQNQQQPVQSSSRFKRDLNEFYATFDTVGYFRNKNISCVLSLRNMIPIGSNIEMVLKDIRKEVEKVGPLVKLTHRGLNIYLEYERVEYSQIAYILLQSRKYDGKQVEVCFYDPIKFADDVLV